MGESDEKDYTVHVRSDYKDGKHASQITGVRFSSPPKGLAEKLALLEASINMSYPTLRTYAVLVGENPDALESDEHTSLDPDLREGIDGHLPLKLQIDPEELERMVGSSGFIFEEWTHYIG